MLADYPHLVQQFHTVRNEAIAIASLYAKSNKKVWWICGKGHEWEAAVCNRQRGTGCPYCAGKKLSSSNSLLAQYPDIASEFNSERNSCSAHEILSGTNRKVWWRCTKITTHEWETAVSTRTKKGHGCPHCAGQTTSDGNTLLLKFPAIAAEWHPTLNGVLTPNDVCPSAVRTVWWKCSKNHEYEALISNRTSKRCTGCPYCTGRIASVENSVASCYPHLIAEWHSTKNEKPATEFTASSGQKVWWKCSAGHEWYATINNRTIKGHGCPCCSGRIAHSARNLMLTHPQIAAEWYSEKNGDITPTHVTPGSSKKYWWKCLKNPLHIWAAKVSNRTCNDTGCPHCKMSHMEKKVNEWLNTAGVQFVAQKRFDDLKGQSVDFYLTEFNAVIECDGVQHFEEVSDYFHHYTTLKLQQERDIKKNNYLKDKRISILRISHKEEKDIPHYLSCFHNALQDSSHVIMYSNKDYYVKHIKACPYTHS